jgi:hypothetical protein
LCRTRYTSPNDPVPISRKRSSSIFGREGIRNVDDICPGPGNNTRAGINGDFIGGDGGRFRDCCSEYVPAAAAEDAAGLRSRFSVRNLGSKADASGVGNAENDMMITAVRDKTLNYFRNRIRVKMFAVLPESVQSCLCPKHQKIKSKKKPEEEKEMPRLFN